MVHFEEERDDELAPVIPLFNPSGAGAAHGGRVPARSAGVSPGGRVPARSAGVSRPQPPTTPPGWHTTWQDEPDDEDLQGTDDGYDECAAIEREIAERNLLKKLRVRQLSVAEARGVVAERDLDAGQVDDVLTAFQSRGYLDDAALAEQLAYVGTDRKGQGRNAIAQTMATRGIPREIADAALAGLPDDDAERALEYARGKARGMQSLDHDTALRRLAGQLARRGYSGGVALSAARTALDETGGSRVRFR